MKRPELTTSQQGTVDAARETLATSEQRAEQRGDGYEIGYLRSTVEQLLAVIDQLTGEGGGQ